MPDRGLGDLVAGPLELHPGAGQDDGAAVGEVALDVLGLDHVAHLVDGGPMALAHGRPGSRAARPGRAAGLGHGEQGRAPPAVAARRAEARPRRARATAMRSVGSACGQVVGRPQAGETAPDDRHVDARRRRAAVVGCRGAREPVPPEREPSVVLARWRAQICFHASVNTVRRMEVITSNSSSPQMRGGASCTTGSPRSSARQIRPAS